MLTCSRDTPLHLWHAASADGTEGGGPSVAGPGHLRASYCAYDHLDEITAALACCFSPDGSLIYCGFERCVRIFHTARPGRDCESRPTSKSRNARDGQKGLISCLAVNCDGGVYAAGSYGKSVGLYDASSGDRLALLPASSGVTQVSFAPDGILLLAGERKSSAIVGWDIRQTSAPLFTCKRELTTNQRLQFDIDPSSAACATADERGRVLVYDIREEAAAPDDSPPLETSLSLYPTAGATVAETVSSVQFHPFLPVFATGSGSRQVPDPTVDSDDSSGEDAGAPGT